MDVEPSPLGEEAVPEVTGSFEPNQTPLFWAINKSRYLRRDWILEIERATGRELIVYISDPAASTSINPDDIPPFGDLISAMEGKDVDLLLNSNGGIIDPAEKMLFMCREKVDSLRVIIPERAKSAATLLALGADEIIMGLTSELGPTDPQIRMPDRTYLPVHSIKNGLEKAKEEIKNDPDMYVVYAPMLDQLSLGLLDLCDRAIEASRSFAEKWLKRYMLAGRDADAERIARQLAGGEVHLLHSEVIDAKKADEMGLNVTYLEDTDPLWKLIWRLYCMYLVDLRADNFCKIFESKTVSIPLREM